MATEIAGLSIQVVGQRPVEPPGGHSYATSIGKAVTKDLSNAGHLSVTPIFAGGAHGTAIDMFYCGRGQSRDVWEGADPQFGGRAVLKVCDIEWESNQRAEFKALQAFQNRIRVPKPLWLGRASIHGKDRMCLLAEHGGTDALVALNGCLRSEEGLESVAQWACGFLERGIDFINGALEQHVFPGTDWTLRQCCVSSPVPGPPSQLVLVDAEMVENLARRKTSAFEAEARYGRGQSLSSWPPFRPHQERSCAL
jgi:hypothetical protein